MQEMVGSGGTFEHVVLKGTPQGTTAEILTKWITQKVGGRKSAFTETSRPIGEVFMTAAKDSGLNPYYLVAHAAHESAWATSNISRTKFNFYGIGAFDNSPMASATTYKGIEGGIIGGAIWIAENYVYSDKYKQDTLHKMRFNNNVHQYATDPGWASKISKIMMGSPMGTGGTIISGSDSPSGGGEGYADIASPKTQETVKLGTGVSGEYTGETFEGQNGIFTKPNFVPPHYYEDDFSQLPNRYTQGDFFMRIGDARFVVPPTQIRVSETTDIQKIQSLRQKQSMKTQAGNKMKTIEMTLMFTDFNQINGYEMEGPKDGEIGIYYMDGLRSLIAQMKTMPFLPVENEFLNLQHGIYAIAMLNCHVGVVEGFPGMLKADVTLLEFDPEAYLGKPDWMYDSHFVWPLFRWHYQRLLNGSTRGSDVLAPFIGDDILEFSIIDELALQGQEEAVVKQAEEDMEQGERYATWWDLNTKLANEDKKNKLYKRFDIIHDYQIVDISGSFGNTLTPLHPTLTGKPVFQYFGSQDARFNVVLHTTSRETINSFNSLKDRVDRYAREYRNRIVSSMLRVENNFINMLGVSGVMIESISVETIEGQPGACYIAIAMISFDETQHRDESLGHLDTIDIETTLAGGTDAMLAQMGGGTLEHFDNNIIHPAAAERLMDEMELYPDLELPTYDEVAAILPIISEWRKARGLAEIPIVGLNKPYGAVFADPDFYFSYPSAMDLIKSMNDALSDADIIKLSLEGGIDLGEDEKITADDADLDKFFGGDAIEGIRSQVTESLYISDYEKMPYNSFAEIEAAWAQARLYVSDPANYVKHFWVKAWSGKNGEWKKTVEKEKALMKDGLEVEQWDVAYYSGQEPMAQVQTMKEDDYFNGMLHDMIRYDRTGTMMRAFPSYAFVIVDEGRYINVRKLWDNYYTYHSISDIDVHMDRKSPNHTAYIRLSNMYATLTAKDVYRHKLKDPGWGDAVRMFMDTFTSHVKETELIERTMLNESIELLGGARIHIRMGYGASASQLPVVFNGVIAEIDTGDVVSIVAESFGRELTNPIGAEPGSTNSMTEQGLEATELFRYYMTVRNSNHTWRWRENAEPENYQSAYGIDHFGFLRVRDEQQVTDIFSGLLHLNFEAELNAEDYDIMKNIYSTEGYGKIGVDESKAEGGGEPEAPDGYIKAEDGDKIVDIPLKKDFKELLPMAFEQWGAPTSKAWANLAKLDMKDIKMGEHKTTNDSIIGGGFTIKEKLENLDEWADVKAAAKAIGEKRVKEEDRRTVVEDMCRWAANPETNSYPPGSPGRKWELTEGRKEKFYHKDIEELLKPIKDADKELYKDTVATMKKISDEWGEITRELSRILNRQIKEDSKPVEQIKEAAEDLGAIGGEGNTRMQLEGKSPWDIFRTLAFVNPEYIVYPHVHQFGYTLFFGKPHWNVQCGYVLPPMTAPPADYGKKVSDYVELTKPFSQLHFFTGRSDIIGNTVRAVGSNLTTAVIPQYHVDDKQKSYEVVWADYYIRGSFQKTLTVDTTLVQDIPFIPSWLERFGDWSAGWGMAIFGGQSKYQAHSARFAQSVIAESFRDMYQGEIVSLGNPSVKPYDLAYIDDYYARMNGTAEIGTVTHSMSVSTGFITSFKPDLSVAVNPDVKMRGEDWEVNPGVASQNFMRMGSKTFTLISLRALQAVFAYTMFRSMADKRNIARLAGLAKFAKVDVAAAKFIKVSGLRWSVAQLGKSKLVLKGASSIVTGGQKIVGGLKAIRAFRLGLAGASVASASTGVGLPAAVVGVVGFIVTSVLITSLEKFFIQKHNNAIKLFPLYYEGKPFVAGINGHRQLIPGWQDSGNGRPVPVGHDNIEKIDPASAGELLGYTMPKMATGIPELDGAVSGDYNGTSAAAKWLPNVNEAARVPGMFVAPIPLNAGKTNFAGYIARTNSGYGPRNGAFHQGEDMKPLGDNKMILALADGEVMLAGPASTWGNVVVLRHIFPMAGGDSYVFFTLYAHLPNGGSKVSSGQSVKAGQVLSPMGTTGKSSGVHLHFEVLIPNDMKKAAAWPRDNTRAYIGGGWNASHNQRRECTAVNPNVFLEEIVAFDPKLMKYIPFSG